MQGCIPSLPSVCRCNHGAVVDGRARRVTKARGVASKASFSFLADLEVSADAEAISNNASDFAESAAQTVGVVSSQLKEQFTDQATGLTMQFSSQASDLGAQTSVFYTQLSDQASQLYVQVSSQASVSLAQAIDASVTLSTQLREQVIPQLQSGLEETTQVVSVYLTRGSQVFSNASQSFTTFVQDSDTPVAIRLEALGTQDTAIAAASVCACVLVAVVATVNASSSRSKNQPIRADAMSGTAPSPRPSSTAKAKTTTAPARKSRNGRKSNPSRMSPAAKMRALNGLPPVEPAPSKETALPETLEISAPDVTSEKAAGEVADAKQEDTKDVLLVESSQTEVESVAAATSSEPTESNAHPHSEDVEEAPAQTKDSPAQMNGAIPAVSTASSNGTIQAGEDPPAPVEAASKRAVPSAVVINYHSGWQNAVVHACVAGLEWGTWPMQRHGDVLTWQAEVPAGASEPVAEFVITDGQGDWDKPPSGENYQLPSCGEYDLRDGQLLPVATGELVQQ